MNNLQSAGVESSIKRKLRLVLEIINGFESECKQFLHPTEQKVSSVTVTDNLVKNPMDLYNIRKKLENDEYNDPWTFIDDFWLIFTNTWSHNRMSSIVYRSCTKLSEIFETEMNLVMKDMGYCCGHKNFFSIHPHSLPTGEDFGKISPLEEPYVNCRACGKKMHQICVLHLDCIWPQGFTCDPCKKSKNEKQVYHKFTSKRLPTTKLGCFIESRVNVFLKDRDLGAGEVYIRVVSSVDKILKVKSGLKNRYDMPATLPYKSKVIFAFEVIDGVDVCFFGMHVQEYGSDCPPPNTRRVYISYLDSVHFFRPRQLRTDVYHEIILGYLEYVKQLGYNMAHIWACPPGEGADYIFHCHPPEQVIPTGKMLQEWYWGMLDKGISRGIVLDYTDILVQLFEENVDSAASIPYFEGDFWANFLEKKLEEHKGDLENNLALIVSGGMGSNSGMEMRKSVKPVTTLQLKFFIKSAKRSDPLLGHILTEMKKNKNDFISIRLNSVHSTASTVIDPDPIIQSDLMDERDCFLALANGNNYEFSTLRRVKFSTMALLYELHDERQDAFVCDNCSEQLENRYTCTICTDYDLCLDCFQNSDHKYKHNMEKIALVKSPVTDSSPSSNGKVANNTIENRLDKQNHAFQCTKKSNQTLFSLYDQNSESSTSRPLADIQLNEQLLEAISRLPDQHSK